jgi:NAD+ synthase (glutamine-hydrolysing)
MPSPELHSELKKELERYRTLRAFDCNSWIDQKVAKFNDYMTKSGLSACVVSLSGGVDSAATLGLVVKASKAPGSPIRRIVAVSQPIASSDWALRRAEECAKQLGVEFVVVDQTDLHQLLYARVEAAIGVEGQSFARGQLRSYMRTPVSYYVTQLLSQQGTPSVVMGTGNMDEDGYLAYFCKAGDGVVDVQLIADLHKSEVFTIAKSVGVPESILIAKPSADLWDGQEDEEELGFPYTFVELLTGHYLKLSESEQKAFRSKLSPAALAQFDDWAMAAEKVHIRNKHKLSSPHNINVMC